MSQKIKIRFADKEVEAELGQTLLEVAHANGIPLDHACGGVCACSTCHVKVRTGADALCESTDDEEDQLDNARGVELCSRLGCQARLERAPQAGFVEVAIPEWNVNLVREGH